MNPLIVTAADVNPEDLHAFLMRFYLRPKCDFLRAHGDGWHGGSENRWVLLVEDQTRGEHNRVIAGYCAVIPTSVLVQHEITPAIWWVDLIIAPEYRGRGLQSLFDKKLQQMDILKLGFPNRLALEIHAKHGWGVRDDQQVLLLPLRPLDVNQVRTSAGWRGRILQLAASVMLPWAWANRQRLGRYQPQTARQLESPSPDILSAIFSRLAHKNIFTTYRDVDYFHRRFFNAPYRNEFNYFIGGKQDTPGGFLITRHLKHNESLVTRILDLFGDFEDEKCMKDILLLALRDAVIKGSSQVTILASQPKLQSLLFKQGFFFKSPSRFCWLSSSECLMSSSFGKPYWTLADSDNDEPE